MDGTERYHPEINKSRPRIRAALHASCHIVNFEVTNGLQINFRLTYFAKMLDMVWFTSHSDVNSALSRQTVTPVVLDTTRNISVYESLAITHNRLSLTALAWRLDSWLIRPAQGDINLSRLQTTPSVALVPSDAEGGSERLPILFWIKVRVLPTLVGSGKLPTSC